MEQILDFFRNLYDRFQELTQGQKTAAMALITVAIGSIFVMSLWMKTPDMQLLYSNLSEEDAAAIVEELKTMQIPYELGMKGTTIRITADKIHETRLQLASKGLPEGSEVGMELFEETSLGMTEFVQKLNYQRALQGELTRTINTIEAVSQSRVHLVIPEDSVFLREKPKGKASITLKLKSGKFMKDSQIQGIVHLVASSVKGISPENVAIVDSKGNILSGAGQVTQDAIVSDSNYKFKRNLEKELETSVVKMLEDALGPGKVVARISADVNFDRIDRTEEIFDPDSQVVRSEQRASENVTGAVPPGGVPGVQALLPTGDTPAGGQGAAAKRNNEKQVFNYEINKVVKRVSKPMGEINKISVSVMIDGTIDENGAYKQRTQQEMAQYLEIVRSAVGFDQDRGDQIKVENIQFDKTLLLEEQKKLETAENLELGFQVAKYVLGAIFILLFFTRVIRPLVTWMTTSVEVVAEGAPGALTAEDDIEEERQRLAELGPSAQDIRKAVNDFVDSDPHFTAGIVRKWMKERKTTEDEK